MVSVPCRDILRTIFLNVAQHVDVASGNNSTNNCSTILFSNCTVKLDSTTFCQCSFARRRKTHTKHNKVREWQSKKRTEHGDNKQDLGDTTTYETITQKHQDHNINKIKTHMITTLVTPPLTNQTTCNYQQQQQRDHG